MPAHWARCAEQLWKSYGGICAYVCIYIPPVVGARSVEHFAGKANYPDLAYEWSNYRLVSARMNSRKGTFEDVLDPFLVQRGWFVLHFFSLEVKPAPGLAAALRKQVQATIDRLKLNDRQSVDARALYFEPYARGELSFEVLARWSPFVAQELVRQGLTQQAIL